MTAGNVYKPSESEPKCPETLVNKQKTARPGLRDQEAAGSNPVTPMKSEQVFACSDFIKALRYLNPGETIATRLFQRLPGRNN